MTKFKNFIESIDMQQDFSHLSKDERLKYGKDIGEKFIRDELLKHGIDIVTVDKKTIDTKWKIDGYLNGDINEPVQIKLRKTSRGDDDIAYELILGYDPHISVWEQLKDSHHQGRDLKGTKVKHYFVLNQQETEIYHIKAEDLKNAAILAIKESPRPITKNSPFKSSLGVDLRATTDNNSGIEKLMAFIPANRVTKEHYTIGQGHIKPTLGTHSLSKKDFNVTAAAERLKKLQAKQRLANELRKLGYKGTDDQIIAQAGKNDYFKL